MAAAEQRLSLRPAPSRERIGLHDDLKIPVIKIGVGEKLEDLRDFHPEEFLNAIL